jgi:xanthosine utilization system XapX-like protein
MSFCGTTTPASRRYQQRMLVTMLLYLAVTLGVVTIVKHAHPHGWLLYAIALVPALPMLAMMGALGVYLQEEKDEYIRLITMRSLLAGTAVLLAVLVVNDVLRSISGTAALPAFTGWVVFFVAFGAAQGVQTMRNRVRDDA